MVFEGLMLVYKKKERHITMCSVCNELLIKEMDLFVYK